jgi:uncharacterized protein YbjT (DUF2867 family)
MILVAGGSGTLGSLLVAEYTRLGQLVRVLTRNPARYRPPDGTDAGAGIEVVRGDVADAAAVDRAVAGADIVVSAMHGLIGPGRDSVQTTDVVGNRNLVQASLRHGVRRFVLLSAHGAARTNPMELVAAKFRAEEQFRSSGLGGVIIRPTSYLETWLEIVAAGGGGTHRPRVLGRGLNPVNFVAAGDVAALVVDESLEAGNSMGRNAGANESSAPFEIGGPANLTLTDLADLLVETGVCAGTVQRVPRAALRAASVVTRPFKPAAARLARAAYLMDTMPMTSDEGDARTRVAGLPLTAVEDAIAAWIPAAG